MTDENKIQDLERKLFQYLSIENTEFVKKQIKESRLDSNFRIISYDGYRQMVNRGIWDTFEKASREAGIEWRHTNEPES